MAISGFLAPLGTLFFWDAATHGFSPGFRLGGGGVGKKVLSLGEVLATGFVVLWLATGAPRVWADGDDEHSQTFELQVQGGVATAGVGLYGLGSGTISIVGFPEDATVRMARLYWTTIGASDHTTVQLNGQAVTGSRIGASGPACQSGGKETYAFRADVTALVAGGEDDDYEISGLPSAGAAIADSFGAALVVVYESPSGDDRHIVISDGSLMLNFTPPRLYTATLIGFEPASPLTHAELTFLVADGQEQFLDSPDGSPDPLRLDGQALGGRNNFVAADGDYWDTTTFDIISYAPTNPLEITLERPVAPSDCLQWIATVLSIESGGEVALDFGDAPEPFATLRRDDGARHEIDSTLFLGLWVDAEVDGQPNIDATGDDLSGSDEQGIEFTAGLFQDRPSHIVATASRAGRLDAWVDFDRDGVWEDPVERVLDGASLVQGPNPLDFDVPATATLGLTYARFRLSSSGNLGPHGIATDGEVEDYRVEIAGLADLSVGLVASPDPVVVDLDLDVVITVSNPLGPDTATDLEVDFVPFPGSSVQAAGDDSWTCVTDPDGVHCRRATLAVGESSEIAIFLEAPSQAGEGTAEVSVRSAELDENAGDNLASATVTVIDPVSDLELRLAESADPVVAGTGIGNLQHTLQVENLGPDTATGLEVGVDLSMLPGVLVDTALPSVGTFDIPSGTWDLGELAAGGLAELSIVYTVEAAAVAGTDAVTTSAAVTAVVERDPEPSNDSALVATSILDPLGVDLGLELLDRPDPVATGTDMTFDVRVSNLGPGRAVGHGVTIELPEEVVLTDLAEGSDWSCTTDDTATPAEIACSGIDLAMGVEAAPIRMTLTVSELATVLEFVARVDWTSFDPTLESLVPRSVVAVERTVTERSWRSAPSLAEGRSGHTTTLLPTGELLVVGGHDNNEGNLASVEIYDPARRTWRAGAPINGARYNHAALLLPKGEVVVVGGLRRTADGDEAVLQDVQCYDPSTNSWSPMPGLSIGRRDFTLTLLVDGSLLVVGGENDSFAKQNSVELLTPGATDWVPTGPLNSPRSNHSATLLRSGEVLVIAGDGVGASKTVELYDPDDRMWTSFTEMEIARREHTATLLADGRVLVVDEMLTTPEIFDRSAGWSEAASKSAGQFEHSATLLADGRVLVAGGKFETAVELATEIYDPILNSWSESSPLEALRRGHTATLLPGGQVVVVGGDQLVGPAFHSVEIFGGYGAQQSVPPQTAVRTEHDALLLFDGSVLATGGLGADGNPTNTTNCYEPEGGWRAEPALFLERSGHRQTLLNNGDVLVTGGYGTVDLAGFQYPDEGREESWDGGDQWVSAGVLGQYRHHHTATRLPDGTVLIVGGEIPVVGVFPPRSDYHRSTEIYDPSCNCFGSGTDLPVTTSRHTATLLPSGKVLVAGGENSGGSLAEAFLYDPAEADWSQAASMSGPRSRHAAVALASGRLLVAGGEGLGAEIYDPESDTWSLTAEQPAVRSDDVTLTSLSSGLVLLVGTLADGSGRLGAQLYDPLRDTWSWVSDDYGRRGHTATALADGRVLVLGGQVEGVGGSEFADPQAVLLDPVPVGVRRPVLTQWSTHFDYRAGSALKVVGEGFRGVSEGSGGTTRQSSTAYPQVQLQALNGGVSGWLGADPAHPIEPDENFWDGSMTLDIDYLPAVFHPGWHRLTVFAGGVPSHSEIVQLDCSLEIEAPQIAEIFDATGTEIDGPRVPVGGWVRFEVGTRGGRRFQWQRNTGSPDLPNWVDIPGATDASFTTPPLQGFESGSMFRVEVSSGCTEGTSADVSLTIDDQDDPVASVSDPNGGEYWPLSTSALAPNIEQVFFEVSDPTTWICGLRASLIYSNDQGATWHEASPNTNMPQGVDGELPRQLGDGEGCYLDNEVLSGTLRYQVPLDGSPPSGQPGSLYKIRLLAIDHAGNTTVAESTHPFFIVPPDDQSVRTLIFFHPERLGVDCGADPEPDVCRKVRELADHPQVAGRVIDLEMNPDLKALYTAWDAADQQAQTTGDAIDRDVANRAANAVLFASKGLQEVMFGRLAALSGVDSVMLVGDDRVIPMARVPDRSGLLGEQAYTDGTDPDLAPNGSTVGRAIDGGFYLSDDPLVALASPVPEPIDVEREGAIFLPDLAVGRLVESPEEIVAAIANFQQREGRLDLTARSKKVLVTGYDFLTDSARSIDEKWRCSFDPEDGGTEGMGCDPASGTVDASLVGQGFGQENLLTALCGGGEPYGLISLNGHANHFLEGVPGTTHFDIQGLETQDMAHPMACGEDPLDLAGAVIYAVGCHGGLSVPDDPADDETLDLPQVLLARGALAYLANSGYGWGLEQGIGYGERLQEIFTDQLRVGDSVTVGRAVLDAKLRYYQEARGLDAYGIKTLMQWTTYGFPMARIETGLGADEATAAILRPIDGPARHRDELPAVEILGSMTIHRSLVGGGSAEGVDTPAYLDRIPLSPIFSQESYVKRTAGGDRVPPNVVGCPSENGCYYTRNGLGDRGSGEGDRPIQPYTVLGSQLAGTSQHGVLWLGGEYREEADWLPVFGTLISNAEEIGSNHGSAPQMLVADPIETPFPPRSFDDDCRVSDLAINTMVIPLGEVRQGPGGSGPGAVAPGSYTIQRRYSSVRLEALYFNNFDDPSQNCDRDGPIGLESGEGPYDGAFHTTHGSTLEWRVPANDPSGVWRVVVVYDARQTLEAADGAWESLELSFDPQLQAWTGSRSFATSQIVTYVLQAVDNRGNVSWLRFGGEVASPAFPGGKSTAGDTGTSSGVHPNYPEPVEVAIQATADLAVGLTVAPDPVSVGAPLGLVVDLAHQGGGPATDVEVEVLPFAGSTVTAVGDAQWSCGTDGDRIVCSRPSFAPDSGDQIFVSLTAPTEPGIRVASARVWSAEDDPDNDDNQATVEVTVVETDLPPRVIRIDSSAKTARGSLLDDDVVENALTQLRVVFDETVSGADNQDHFLLVEAGPDGILQSESVALGPSGDDVVMPLGEVTYESETLTTVLGLLDALPLPRGTYGLLVGNGIYDTAFQFLDGDGDGVEGGDFRRAWRVERQHRIVNPNFDRSLASWVPMTNPAGQIDFRSLDSEAVPSSGSVVMERFGGLPASFAIGQCVPVVPGERLAFGARLRRAVEDSWDTLELQAAVYSSVDCNENLLRQAVIDALAVDPGGDGTPWGELPMHSIDVPDAGSSLLLALVAASGNGEGPAEIGLDNVELYSTLFADGFETGDTSRWSRVVDE